jgi:signal peptidase I
MDPGLKDQSGAPSQVMSNALDLLAGNLQEFSLPVQGNSMLPLIREGDLLLVRQSADDLKPGEILVFRQGDQLVAHRVLTIYQPMAGSVDYLTKGDHAMAPDPPISKKQVVGKVAAIRRGDRQMRLDGPGWAWVNRGIGLAMLGWIKTNQSSSPIITDGVAGKTSGFSRGIYRMGLAERTSTEQPGAQFPHSTVRVGRLVGIKSSTSDE